MQLSAYMGGARTYSISGNTQLKYGMPRVQLITPTDADISLLYPDATYFQLGGPHFIFLNMSETYSFTIRRAIGEVGTEVSPLYSAVMLLTSKSTVTPSFGSWAFQVKALP